MGTGTEEVAWISAAFKVHVHYVALGKVTEVLQGKVSVGYWVGGAMRGSTSIGIGIGVRNIDDIVIRNG